IPNGLNVEAVELDVTDEEAVKDFFSKRDQVDILFNGAGANFENQYEFSTYKKLMNLNANSVFHLSTLVHPLLKKSDIGSIVNVSSMYAIFGSDMAPAYSASKGAIDQITKSLDIEYADDGIRVYAVSTGCIYTTFVGSLPEEMVNEINKRTTMDRLGKPEEIGKVVAFLSSPAEPFVTGTVLSIDGAYSIM